MGKSKLAQLTLASIAAITMSPVGGVAMASSYSSNSSQGNWHHGHDNHINWDYEIENSNEVDFNGSTLQTALSGGITAENNTTVGDVRSGVTDNSQSTEAVIEATINTETMYEQGVLSNQLMNSSNNDMPNNNCWNHHNDNETTSETTIENENEIEITSNVDQTAISGNVIVSKNTTVGDVSTGAAINSSTNTFAVTLR